MPTGKHSPANNHPTADPLPDPSRPAKPHHQPLDRLVPAGWLVGAALAVVAASLLTLTVDARRGLPSRHNDAALFDAIGLYELALAPSGRQARRPDLLPTPVDWRYLPILPKQDPGLIPLLDEEQLATPQAAAP
jgi:hypothetical protein